jgi:metal-responsive CopG/Arc/MetJ family transcriptional regulator
MRSYEGSMALKETVSHDLAMKRTVVWLTGEQAAELARISARTFAPVSALVRKAVQQFLRKKRKSARQTSS